MFSLFNIVINLSESFYFPQLVWGGSSSPRFSRFPDLPDPPDFLKRSPQSEPGPGQQEQSVVNKQGDEGQCVVKKKTNKKGKETNVMGIMGGWVKNHT